MRWKLSVLNSELKVRFSNVRARNARRAKENFQLNPNPQIARMIADKPELRCKKARPPRAALERLKFFRAHSRFHSGNRGRAGEILKSRAKTAKVGEGISIFLKTAVGMNREPRKPREKKEPERNLSSPKDLTYSRSY